MKNIFCSFSLIRTRAHAGQPLRHERFVSCTKKTHIYVPCTNDIYTINISNTEFKMSKYKLATTISRVAAGAINIRFKPEPHGNRALTLDGIVFVFSNICLSPTFLSGTFMTQRLARLSVYQQTQVRIPVRANIYIFFVK